MYLKSYHLVPGQTINVFGAIFGISLPLISKGKAVRQIAGLSTPAENSLYFF
jgi:hypothetical protein